MDEERLPLAMEFAGPRLRVIDRDTHLGSNVSMNLNNMFINEVEARFAAN